MKSALAFPIAALALLAAAPVAAETLSIESIEPAGSEALIGVRTIAVEPFLGLGGDDFRARMISSLASANVDGQPLFEIRNGFDRDDADIVIGGRLGWDQDIYSVEPEITKKCVERDDDDKCIKRVRKVIPCNRLDVSISPELHIREADDAELIFAFSDYRTNGVTHCSRHSLPSGDGIGERLLSSTVSDLRRELAPRQVRTDQRILERREGMKGEGREQFKQAIKLVEHDPILACMTFRQLEAEYPAHASVLFNIALCSEADGNFEQAVAYYNKVLESDAGHARSRGGITRIAATRLAEQQLAAHFADEALAEETLASDGRGESGAP